MENDSDRIFACAGVGIDLVDVDRIRKLIEKYGDAFLEKTFTAQEISACAKRTDAAMRFAARFAAKEAMAKALGTGFSGDVGLKSLWIENNPDGAPIAHMDENAAKIAQSLGASKMLVSLTHLKDYAQAIAILSK